MDIVRIADTFVELADAVVSDFDALDLLHTLVTRCVELFEVDAAGLLLADAAGRLRATVATSHDARSLDLLQAQDTEGPGPDCYRGGTAVAIERLDDAHGRWPRFCAQATGAGYSSALALPMRLREEVLGVLTLLTRSGEFPAGGRPARVAQAMADAATIAIVQYRVSEERRVRTEQLEFALESRVVVEQAKGILTNRLQVDEQEAFELLRARARFTRRLLIDVAEEVRRSGPDTDWADYGQADPSGDG